MIKVMIVDDKPMVCRGLREMIPWESLDAKIVGDCRNGQEALETALVQKPDVIITDVRMPVMDGIELCKHIRERLPETIVFILSAFHEFSYAQAAIRYGVSDYILKPIDKQKIGLIADKIEQVAHRRETKRQMHAMLYGKQVQEQISEHLKEGNGAFFEGLLEDIFQQMGQAGQDTVTDIGLKLLALFLEAVKAAGISPNGFGLSFEEISRELFSLQTREEWRAKLQGVFQETVQFVNDRKNSRSETIVEHLIGVMRHKFHDPDLTVYKIAHELGLSPNYISVIFRQYTGENISAYITRLRMEKALELLTDIGYPIREVAQSAGFHDPHYFSKVFKKSEGLTPSQYRNLVQRGEGG
ncbi:response regulator [Paenibacillus sp. HB172176]|uniref:response regulator transcription factor n=1 Tax=Paenibacillus sp. HB172176 TaxID=2493690 RepID=UPI00143AB7CA|nr:response regulator [Paenibacillus sp. HB172176]